MKEALPKIIHLKDYQVPEYLIESVHLCFDLHDTETLVRSVLKVHANPASSEKNAPLVLNGEELKLKSVKLDGRVLDPQEYTVTEEHLTLSQVPGSFQLEIENTINPQANTCLDGLYKSGGMFCTQNEPEGFRRITYFLDRPDVMAKFTTKVIADKSKYPILLSNGNPIRQGDLPDGKHFVEWEDPFPKPTYLFALVAGDLGLIEDSYRTKSGRTVDLRIYCDKGNENKCDHAMKSLINSMRWDEERFGLEYDLDIYMIVAVDSFNMGAMENKGLNIFNSAYVLARQETATDTDFLNIEGVVGHEYFHNWTGNRVTCRDWFQLTLKEGLTVFRDQEFSADLNSRTVQRIGDVHRLRARQFLEDAGPTSHPIKPASYMEINNFYTATVYEKGAEVIRMLETFVGREGFRKGVDLYFKKFDGQAVTTEDWLAAQAEANDFDTSQFENWYHQAGTPRVTARWKFLEGDKFELTLEQFTPATPGQPEKQPLLMPFKLGILSPKGEELELKLTSSSGPQEFLDRGVLEFSEAKETYVFEGVPKGSVPSLNRGFSAPIRLKTDHSLQDKIFLLAHDTDGFNRYEASQQLGIEIIQALIEQKENGEKLYIPAEYLQALRMLLEDHGLDDALKAECLKMPTEDIVIQEQSPNKVEQTYEMRSYLMKAFAREHADYLAEIYHFLEGERHFDLGPASMGRRKLRNVLLEFLVETGEEKYIQLAYEHFKDAKTMTDEIGALTFLCDTDSVLREKAIKEFIDKWKGEQLVVQKWMAAQAGSRREDTLARVKELEKHPLFDKTIPNFVWALYRAFGRNLLRFHDDSGEGYEFLADKVIELDPINPHAASAMAGMFKDYDHVDSKKKGRMRKALERVREKDHLSKNTLEIIGKILGES